MRSLLQRVMSRLEQRLPALTRYRRPERLPIALHRKRIYIIPSAFGVGFSILLLVMLVGSLNYTNNAALLLTCLLGAASAGSMLVAFRALDGLRLMRISAGHAVAGQPIEIHLDFESVRARKALRLDHPLECIAFAIEAGKPAKVQLRLPTEQRGWQALPQLRLWSSWPLGLFRAWSWMHPDSSVLVWPKAEVAGPPPQAPADDARHMRLHQGDELATLRDYRRGDPQRHIAWKASARHPNLLVKDFEQPHSQPEWRLDWRQLSALGHEARIARLARWVDEAEVARRHYSLWLPDEQIASGCGPLQHDRCMDALAQMP